MNLKEAILTLIAQEGPISVERYMALALTHPTLGYYTTRDPFGASGDFVTAPDISQIFGELIGLWAAEVWRLMGEPPTLSLIELGPGRGTLMSDALRAARRVPAFFQAAHPYLVEISPVLRAQQRQTLAASGKTPTWLTVLEAAPDGPAIIIANEFYDALPVRHYVKTSEGWRERLVGLDAHGGLTFGLSPETAEDLAAGASEGAILEIGSHAQRHMQSLAERLVRGTGAALVIDYGYTRKSWGETLQALKGHKFVDPLAEPGLADLTAHVDFGSLAQAVRTQGAHAFGPIDQGIFLNALGAWARCERLCRAQPGRSSEIMAGYERLCGEGTDQMGALFKVLAAASPNLSALPGFPPLSTE